MRTVTHTHTEPHIHRHFFHAIWYILLIHCTCVFNICSYLYCCNTGKSYSDTSFRRPWTAFIQKPIGYTCKSFQCICIHSESSWQCHLEYYTHIAAYIQVIIRNFHITHNTQCTHCFRRLTKNISDLFVSFPFSIRGCNFFLFLWFWPCSNYQHSHC